MEPIKTYRGFQLTTGGSLVSDAARLFPAERGGLSRSRPDGRSVSQI